MFAEDLMIGDWVLFDDNLNKIRSLTDDNGCTLSNKLHSAMTYDLKPVPLTNDILEKNGFHDTYIDMSLRKDNVYKWFNIYGYCVKVDLNTNKIKFDHDNEIILNLAFNGMIYVHELQHIFKNLEIKKDITIL